MEELLAEYVKDLHYLKLLQKGHFLYQFEIRHAIDTAVIVLETELSRMAEKKLIKK